ncbi:MAG: hypothetical protein NZM09_03410 [Ignavibacterium sp.]|nr:hypothetical protein [Ignavibacterium sp.]MDW8374727.1 hypothetical protein [Ignavibacteriales bacterium]
MNINTMLAMGALLLFSFISLNFNGVVLQNLTNEIDNKVFLTAFSLADDLIEEIKLRAFDEKTVVFQAINKEQLTSTNSLGPDSGEVSVNNYDDIDDYNGFVKNVSLPHAENYTIISNVYYVNENNQDLRSFTQTFYKRVDVKVNSPYMSNEVKLSFIFTLHSK